MSTLQAGQQFSVSSTWEEGRDVEKRRRKRDKAYISREGCISPNAYSSGRFPFISANKVCFLCVCVQYGLWVDEAVLRAWGKLHGEVTLWRDTSKLWVAKIAR